MGEGCFCRVCLWHLTFLRTEGCPSLASCSTSLARSRSMAVEPRDPRVLRARLCTQLLGWRRSLGREEKGKENGGREPPTPPGETCLPSRLVNHIPSPSRLLYNPFPQLLSRFPQFHLPETSAILGSHLFSTLDLATFPRRGERCKSFRIPGDFQLTFPNMSQLPCQLCPIKRGSCYQQEFSYAERGIH